VLCASVCDKAEDPVFPDRLHGWDNRDRPQDPQCTYIVQWYSAPCKVSPSVLSAPWQEIPGEDSTKCSPASDGPAGDGRGAKTGGIHGMLLRVAHVQ
jgi:hypothetical protein